MPGNRPTPFPNKKYNHTKTSKNMDYIKAGCPTLGHILSTGECMENLAGLGSAVYVGVRGDLAANGLTVKGNQVTMSATPFAANKGLYKFECKNESQKVGFSSLGRRKGYDITGTLILEAVNKRTAAILRGMNNLDIFLVFEDSGEHIIVYDPIRKIEAESGGIAGDTGDAADSDRQITLEYHLKPMAYPLYYLDLPEGKTLDDLLSKDSNGPVSPIDGNDADEDD